MPLQIKDIGSGNFGVAWLAQKLDTGETVAIKFIERGENIDENVQREIINHRQLQHRNVIAFRSVALTSTHLAIIMEYAAGGELFQVTTCNSRARIYPSPRAPSEESYRVASYWADSASV